METRANHVLIGAFTLLVTILAFAFALGAANYSSNRKWDQYEVVFSEAVTGLGNGGIVQYNGINVGEVTKLRLDPKDPRKVVARIRLEHDTPVKIDTKAKLAFVGLTGVAQIQLTGGLPESPRLEPTPEQPIPRIPTTPSALQNLSAAADDLVERVRSILSDENIARISGTLDDIHQLSSSVAGQKDDIAALVKNLKDVSVTLNATLLKAQGSLDTIDKGVVQNLPELTAKLDRTLSSLEETAKNANGMLAENRQPLADFSQNGLGQIAPTLAELRVLVRDLRRISSRLDRNPAGYATGRTHPEEFSPNESK